MLINYVCLVTDTMSIRRGVCVCVCVCVRVHVSDSLSKCLSFFCFCDFGLLIPVSCLPCLHWSSLACLSLWIWATEGTGEWGANAPKWGLWLEQREHGAARFYKAFELIGVCHVRVRQNSFHQKFKCLGQISWHFCSSLVSQTHIYLLEPCAPLCQIHVYVNKNFNPLVMFDVPAAFQYSFYIIWL